MAGEDSSTGNGIRVEKGAKVLLIIDAGKTLTVTGKNAEGNGIGYAAILLPEGSTLTVAGAGTLNATGGKAGNGMSGGNAQKNLHGWKTEKGGDGGYGGGGAGAGIGTNGGNGNSGGKAGGGRANLSEEQGTVQFRKVSGNSKLTISSDGKVTAKKGLTKGKTYTLKYKVRIKATKNCKATKYVTGTVKVKIRK